MFFYIQISYQNVIPSDLVHLISYSGGTTAQNILFFREYQKKNRFVKHYRAHLSPIVSVSASVDGMMYASVSAEGEGGSIKIFDVKNFGRFPLVPILIHKCTTIGNRKD
jgi:peptidylprolyl isomerase domain and WD repeat-containing protein 1